MKTLVVIDTNFIYHTLRDNTRLDYDKAIEYLNATYDYPTIWAYGLQTEKRTPFSDLLDMLGYIVKFDVRQFQYQCIHAHVVVDVLRVAPKIDRFVLCSGDISFVPLTTELLNLGIAVEVCSEVVATDFKNVIITELPEHLKVKNENI
jgi:hypothetical protein